MGRDIHAHLEIKKGGKWLYYSPVPITRSYDLFARMAKCGRMTETNPIAPNRGIPSDVSDMTRLHREHWGADGHSDSWLTSGELWVLGIEYKNRGDYGINRGFLEDNRVYLFGNSVEYLHKYPGDYPEWLEDVRLVFWFDN